MVGAGPAGTAAALRAAELGASVVVLEAGSLGGACVNSGGVSLRVLAQAARSLRGVTSLRAEDLALAWVGAVEQARERVDRVRLLKQDAERFAAAGVEVVQEGRARFVDAQTLVLGSGRQIVARDVVICVGGRSRRLAVPGADLALVPEDVLTLASLPRRIAVIGAGNTGAQLASIFRSFGAQVTVLEVGERVLGSSDPSVSAVVSAGFLAQGINIRVGVREIEQLERAGASEVALRWSVDGWTHEAVFDSVVMATGQVADVDELGVQNAGIELDWSSVPVDQHLRTIVPHVFAAGDVHGEDMLVQAAEAEGVLAAENAVLGAHRGVSRGLLPAGGFAGPEYAGVGLTEPQAWERDVGCVVVSVPYSSIDRAVMDGVETGFLKLIADRTGQRLLGAHAVGENALEVIQMVTAAMVADVRASTLSRVQFAYPSYGAIVGVAARALLAEAGSASR